MQTIVSLKFSVPTLQKLAFSPGDGPLGFGSCCWVSHPCGCRRADFITHWWTLEQDSSTFPQHVDFHLDLLKIISSIKNGPDPLPLSGSKVSFFPQGSNGEVVGVVEFWVRLFNSAEQEQVETVKERGNDRQCLREVSLDWKDSADEVKLEFFVICCWDLPMNMAVDVKYARNISNQTERALFTAVCRSSMSMVGGSLMSWRLFWNIRLDSMLTGHHFPLIPTWHTGSTTCRLMSLKLWSALWSQCSLTKPATP